MLFNSNLKKLWPFALILITLISCQEPKIEQLVYKGSDKEAIISNILNRRAIRKYTTEQVGAEKIDTIMRSAIYAPSALNKQPWEIRVVQNPTILEEFNKRFIAFAQGKEFQGSAANYKKPGFSIFHSAPTVIVIASDKSNPNAKMDVGIALQNILLSADALGLGTCPLGTLVPILNLPENQDLLKLLNIPEGYEVAINVALGYPNESPTAPIRYSDKVKIIK